MGFSGITTLSLQCSVYSTFPLRKKQTAKPVIFHLIIAVNTVIRIDHKRETSVIGDTHWSCGKSHSNHRLIANVNRGANTEVCTFHIN